MHVKFPLVPIRGAAQIIAIMMFTEVDATLNLKEKIFSIIVIVIGVSLDLIAKICQKIEDHVQKTAETKEDVSGESAFVILGMLGRTVVKPDASIIAIIKEHAREEISEELLGTHAGVEMELRVLFAIEILYIYILWVFILIRFYLLLKKYSFFLL